MSTTTEPGTLGRWPASCGEPSCAAHLPRKSNRCRCPRYRASAPGYHITRLNLDCPVHRPDVTATNGEAVAWQPAVPRDVSTVDGIAAAVRRGYSDEEVAAARLGHRPTCEFRIWGRGTACTCGQAGATLPPDVAAMIYEPELAAERVRADVCHRPIAGTDDILGPCPQCGHLIAVHVGTDGCPVCVVEMLAAAHRAATTQERQT